LPRPSDGSPTAQEGDDRPLGSLVVSCAHMYSKILARLRASRKKAGAPYARACVREPRPWLDYYCSPSSCSPSVATVSRMYSRAAAWRASLCLAS
jgi:hypothetical protein